VPPKIFTFNTNSSSGNIISRYTTPEDPMMKQHFYEMNNSGGSGNGAGPGPALGNLKSMVLAASAA
jgi:hypothetical protein